MFIDILKMTVSRAFIFPQPYFIPQTVEKHILLLKLKQNIKQLRKYGNCKKITLRLAKAIHQFYSVY